MTQLLPILSSFTGSLLDSVWISKLPFFPLKLSLLVILSTSLNSYNGILLPDSLDPVPSPFSLFPPLRPSLLLVLSPFMPLSFGILSQLNSDPLLPPASPYLTSSPLSKPISSIQLTHTWLRRLLFPEPLYSGCSF